MDSLIYESGLFIPEPATQLELEPCPICKRTFVPATLEKHIGICQKMQTNKRKIFDSSQKRREGTELEKYMPPPQLSTLASIRSRFSPPKQSSKLTTKLVELKGATSPLGNATLGRQGRSNSTSSQGTIGEYVRKRSLSKEPASDRCPYCDRNFGIRAYDRHVEWCKEKAILKAHGAQPATDAVGKERLNARINYKAPSLRTKRGQTRDKYSPFDDVFMKSFVHNNSKSRSEAGRSLSNSMTSSLISDSGFSDKYDPFMSAKRQMEELFSPNSKETTPVRQTAASSGRSTPIVARKPIGKAITPTVSRITPNDSSFRRTMSLRLPKRTSPKPVPKPMPTSIQMGITDDGPISTNFVKPEEYDEMPVRSVYSTLATNTRFTPSPPAAAVMRNPDSIPNRKNLKLSLNKINLPSIDFPISKTDSLATFLNYEKHLGLSAFSEKDVKDTNNILNKQSQSMKKVVEMDDSSDVDQDQENVESNLGSFEKLEEIVMKTSTPRTELLLDKGMPMKPSAKVVLSPIDMNKVNEKMKQLELEFEAKCHEDQIDPKLINTCDNLSISLSKLSDTENTSSTGSQETTKPSPMPGGLSHSNSERKVQLKRQIKLEKDHILYDKTPPATASADVMESDPFSDEYDRKLSQVEDNEKRGKRLPEREKYFDDFDFEEFINTFEDDEQNPIFKGYKDMLRSNSKLDQEEEEEEISDVADDNEDDEEDDAYYTGTNNEEGSSRTYPAKENQFEDQAKAPTPVDNSNEFIFSTDSSYGSLTRQSTPEKEDAMRPAVVTRTCSNQSIASVKLSRFCYECGSEFIVPKAKFCMECGVKRVVLE